MSDGARLVQPEDSLLATLEWAWPAVWERCQTNPDAATKARALWQAVRREVGATTTRHRNVRGVTEVTDGKITGATQYEIVHEAWCPNPVYPERGSCPDCHQEVTKMEPAQQKVAE